MTITEAGISAWVEACGTQVAGNVVLAIDPGTANMAICVLTRGHADTAYTKRLVVPTLPGVTAKVLYLDHVLDGLIREFEPELIVKEGPAHFASFGVADAGRVQYAIERLAYAHNLPLITIAPMTMRTFVGAAGKGKTKSDTKLQVFKKWGVEFPTEDETDAFALAQTGLAIAHGEYAVKPKRAKRG
jgi:Holliday junction resolvasome RuvABC endonuclease subunit